MTDIAKGLSNDLAEVVERGGTSVVRVESSRTPGSGVVWSADGVIVAASHSVEGDEGIEVGLPDGSTTPATLVGRDPTTDVAALRVSTTGLAVPSWADPSGIKVGHLVLALSRPGRSVRASLGIVSVRGEAWRTPSGGRLDHYVQTDLVRHPGFSGGLLVGAGGEALGLNTSGLLRGATLAVTSPTLRRVVEALLAHGQVRRGFVGVGTYPVRLPAPLEKEAGRGAGQLRGPGPREHRPRPKRGPPPRSPRRPPWARKVDESTNRPERSPTAVAAEALRTGVLPPAARRRPDEIPREDETIRV